MFRQGPFVLEGDAPSEPSSGFGVLISRLDHAVRLVNSGPSQISGKAHVFVSTTIFRL